MFHGSVHKHFTSKSFQFHNIAYGLDLEVIEEHPSEVFHKICVPHYILCYLANYSMLDCLLGKKFADLGLLVKLTLVPLCWIETTLNLLFCFCLHMSLTAGWEKN